MFNKDFYPTPEALIDTMAEGYDITGKVILDPEAGDGRILEYITAHGGTALGCEIDKDLQEIAKRKCLFIGEDFLKVEAHQISHIDAIFMNPPFSADEKHILHAWEIAPDGCYISAICNLNTIEKPYTEIRKRLGQIISENGLYEPVYDAFSTAARRTSVNIAVIKIKKPTSNYEQEFEGFFMEDEPEQATDAVAGLVQYNSIRDVVHRYISAIKIFDQQLATAERLHEVTNGFFVGKIGMRVTRGEMPITRNEFKKDLQKVAWQWVFDKMNMEKIATTTLKADINKFVEKQFDIPFTMKNVFRMLEVVIGTTSQRMDKALLDVFDRLTQHYDENRYNVEGWKTNKHYLLGMKFIIPYMCPTNQWNKGPIINTSSRGEYFNLIEDFLKALCYFTGDNYDHFMSFEKFVRYPYKLIGPNGRYYSCENNYRYFFSEMDEANRKVDSIRQNTGVSCEIVKDNVFYGETFDWGYFRVKVFKKGTVHFQFKDENLWARFNQKIAALKGYPLFEHAGKQKDYGKRPEAKKPAPASTKKETAHKMTVLAEIEI